MVTPTPTTVQVKMQLRGDTAANWASVNPVLLAREVGLETDTKKVKVGDGTTAWNSLAYFPSIVSGGTVLGNLEIGTTGTLTFEGSTADGFETTLGVINPTADRTINLPNQSGTVVVTGNASIVDADIAANAEIAVSKLANGTANQVIVTDGTNVSWSDDLTLAGNLTVNGTTTTVNTETLVVKDKNIEMGVVGTPTDLTADGGGITLKGTTDKTINWIDATDAWTSSERFSVPLGSAASPSLTFTGDENTGIYSPGGDQLAISTNGAQRATIDSSGRLLVGTASDSGSALLVIKANASSATGGGSIQIQRGTANPSGTLGSVTFADSSGSTGATIYAATDGAWAANDYPASLVFSTTADNASSPTERLRITSDGKVGLGTSAPDYNLHVSNGGGSTLSLDRNDTFIEDQDYIGGLRFGHLDNNGTPPHGTGIKVIADGTFGEVKTHFLSGNRDAWDSDLYALTIDSSGRVGIGTTSPNNLLTLNSNTANTAVTIQSSDTGDAAIVFGDQSDFSRGRVVYDNSTDSLAFETNNLNEAFRITSSRQLLVGTSSGVQTLLDNPRLQTFVGDQGAASFIRGSNNEFGVNVHLAKSRNTSPGSRTIVQNNDELGSIWFAGDDGVDLDQAAARIYCQVDGTPGANDMPGRLVFSTTADGASSPTERMRIDSNGLQWTQTSGHGHFIQSSQSAGTTYAFINGRHSSTGINTGTSSFFVYTNGNVTNTNNSYGAISDIKLKENIVDANSQWDDLKALQVRNYNFKEGQTHTQIGLIAQEVELVSPGLVSESPDRDEDGNDLGTVTKSVNYSVLYMKAVKALQEAMERIEQLETEMAAVKAQLS